VAGISGPKRVAWIYEDTGGISLATFFTAGEPNHRQAAEIVASVAEILDPLVAGGRIHPGLSCDDVLIHGDARVEVTGFVSPFARAPVHREPRGAEDSTAVVWRLGVLLAEILTGVPPTPATDRAGHDLALRRLLIRVMSRPGPVFTERYRDWLTGMMAWEADQRPPLHRVAPALRELAATSPGEPLAAICARVVPELRRRAEDVGPTLVEPSLEIVPTNPPTATTAERTEEASAVAAEFGDSPFDDETAISHDADPSGPAPRSTEYGAIPVGVGPPPEAVPKPARLPEELFVEASAPTTTVTDDAPPDRRLFHWLVAGSASAVLLVVALILGWYVLT
jgi:hypothetical protein